MAFETVTFTFADASGFTDGGMTATLEAAYDATDTATADGTGCMKVTISGVTGSHFHPTEIVQRTPAVEWSTLAAGLTGKRIVAVRLTKLNHKRTV